MPTSEQTEKKKKRHPTSNFQTLIHKKKRKRLKIQALPIFSHFINNQEREKRRFFYPAMVNWSHDSCQTQIFLLDLERKKEWIEMRKLTVLLLCSAATASPKAIKSKTKTVMSKSFEAMVESGECCREQNNAGFIHSLSLCLCCVL